jgi:hypothetical protein
MRNRSSGYRPKAVCAPGPLKNSACDVSGLFTGLPPYELQAGPFALKNERTAPPWPSDCSVVLGGCTRGRDLPRFNVSAGDLQIQ